MSNAHGIHWWQFKEAAESKAGKSLGLDKRQNGETHGSFTFGGYGIGNN